MRIHIVSAVFPPEPIVSSRTSADLADGLARNGHQVRVITSFPNRPAGKLYAGYKRTLCQSDGSFSGFRVLRCFSVISSQSGMLSRFLENFSFGFASALAILLLEKPDLVYANTWPIFAQGLLALACGLRRIPLVMNVEDIYPESLAVQGRVSDRRNWLFRLLRWFDQKTARTSAGLVVISEHFRRIYAEDRGIPAAKLHMVPNWIDENLVQVDPPDNCTRASHGIPEDAFLVVYGGNIGPASGLDTVIKAFQTLADDQNVHLLVAGSGSKLLEWRELAGRLGNPRVQFHSPWLEAETSSVLAAASLLILPTQGSQSFVSVPSKLITYMLSGRPILCCAAPDSDIAIAIRDAACGWVVPVDDCEGLSQRLRELSRLPLEELRRVGEHGRLYALDNMTRRSNLPRLVKILENIR